MKPYLAYLTIAIIPRMLASVLPRNKPGSLQATPKQRDSGGCDRSLARHVVPLDVLLHLLREYVSDLTAVARLGFPQQLLHRDEEVLVRIRAQLKL